MVGSSPILITYSGVMVSVLAWSAVDGGFESHSDHTKDYKIGMCCFSSKLIMYWPFKNTLTL